AKLAPRLVANVSKSMIRGALRSVIAILLPMSGVRWGRTCFGLSNGSAWRADPLPLQQHAAPVLAPLAWHLDLGEPHSVIALFDQSRLFGVAVQLRAFDGIPGWYVDFAQATYARAVPSPDGPRIAQDFLTPRVCIGLFQCGEQVIHHPPPAPPSRAPGRGRRGA